VGSRFEEVYRNTHLKQERGAQIEAIRSEVFATYATKQDSDSSLVATAMGAAAASLGGLGGLGPSTSNSEVDPSDGKVEEEEEDETVSEATEPAADLSLKKSTGEAASSSSSADSPSRPPPDEEDSQTSTSGSKSITDPIIQTGVGAAARGLGGVGGLGQTNSEQEEEGATSSVPSQISSADIAKDPIVQTAIGAAALGLGGVGGLGRTSSEPSPSPGEEEEGSSGKVLPMGVVGATPAQVSRALKVQSCLHMAVDIQWQVHFEKLNSSVMVQDHMRMVHASSAFVPFLIGVKTYYYPSCCFASSMPHSMWPFSLVTCSLLIQAYYECPPREVTFFSILR